MAAVRSSVVVAFRASVMAYNAGHQIEL